MKKWLIEHWLPMWAKETVLHENQQLHKENMQLHQQNRELKAYIRGLRTGLRKTNKGGTQ